MSEIRYTTGTPSYIEMTGNNPGPEYTAQFVVEVKDIKSNRCIRIHLLSPKYHNPDAFNVHSSFLIAAFMAKREITLRYEHREVPAEGIENLLVVTSAGRTGCL